MQSYSTIDFCNSHKCVDVPITYTSHATGFYKNYDFTKFQVELTAEIEENAESKQKDSSNFQITQFVVPYFKDCNGMVGTGLISYNAIEADNCNLVTI